jgi:hypothetical protein
MMFALNVNSGFARKYSTACYEQLGGARFLQENAPFRCQRDGIQLGICLPASAPGFGIGCVRVARIIDPVAVAKVDSA